MLAAYAWLRRPTDLEQVRAFSLAPPATNSIAPTLLARLYALFNAFFSALYAATISTLILPLPVFSTG